MQKLQAEAVLLDSKARSMLRKRNREPDDDGEEAENDANKQDKKLKSIPPK